MIADEKDARRVALAAADIALLERADEVTIAIRRAGRGRDTFVAVALQDEHGRRHEVPLGSVMATFGVSGRDRLASCALTLADGRGIAWPPRAAATPDAAPREESTVPGRPELEGTFAEWLARLRADSAFALWAVRYGSHCEAAWRECPRADWMLDAIELLPPARDTGQGRDGVVARHRRVVHVLADAATRAYLPTVPPDMPDAQRIAIRSAIDAADEWATCPVARLNATAFACRAFAEALTPFVGNGMMDVARPKRADAAGRRFSATAAAFFTATAAFDARAVPTAALSASLAIDGSPCSSAVADMVRAEFEVFAVFPSAAPDEDAGQ